MKKVTLGLILITACNVPNFNDNHPFVVKEIDTIDGPKCVYKSWDGSFVVSNCGEFNIGDTIKLTK